MLIMTQNQKNHQMKNLRKLSRKELKGMSGGANNEDRIRPGISIGSGAGDTFRCCNTQTGSCGPCGGPGACDVGYQLASC